MPTNTACSSSLVATHLAARSLALRECGPALAAGANAVLLPLGASAAMSQASGKQAEGKGRGAVAVARLCSH